MNTTNELEEPIMVVDRIIIIEDWLNAVKQELDNESLSYGDILAVDSVYEVIK